MKLIGSTINQQTPNFVTSLEVTFYYQQCERGDLARLVTGQVIRPILSELDVQVLTRSIISRHARASRKPYPLGLSSSSQLKSMFTSITFSLPQKMQQNPLGKYLYIRIKYLYKVAKAAKRLLVKKIGQRCFNVWRPLPAVRQGFDGNRQL